MVDPEPGTGHKPAVHPELSIEDQHTHLFTPRDNLE